MELRTGNGGWHRIDGDHGIPGRVYFRLQEVDGHLRLTELYLDGRGEPLPPSAVRRLPIQMLEQWAAAAPTARARLGVIGPDLSRLAAFFSTTFGKASHWVADSFRAQVEGSDVRQVPYPKETGASAAPPPLELEVPADGRLTDQFLTDVARAYDAAVARRLAPANALGELAGVSPRTVHRWVYTARQRGLMAPATSKGRIV